MYRKVNKKSQFVLQLPFRGSKTLFLVPLIYFIIYILYSKTEVYRGVYIISAQKTYCGTR